MFVLRRILLLLGFMGLFALPGLTQDPMTQDPITPGEIQEHVDYLASDGLEGRDAGTKGSVMAAKYISNFFKKKGLKSQLAVFDLPGGAVPGEVVLKVDGEIFKGITKIRPDALSGVGSFTCKAVLKGGPVEGALVLVKSDQDKKKTAKALFEAGALGVCFLSEDEELTTKDTGMDFRRMGRSGPQGMLKGLSKDGKKKSSKVPEGLRKKLAEQLGLDMENVSFEFKVVGPGDLEDLPDGAIYETGDIDDAPEGLKEKLKGLFGKDGMVDFKVSTGGLSFGPARLQAPVMEASRPIGEALLQAAEKGLPVTINIPAKKKGQCANVLAVLEGSDPELKHEYVVIGGHYDHVGADDKGNVWNGADDNASGTAGVMEIAEALASMDTKPRRSIIFAAWGAEEVGLVGSKAFLKNPLVPKEQIVAYINMDMISRNNPESIGILHSSEEMKAWTCEAAEKKGFKVKDDPPFFLQASDTGPFVNNKIPCVALFSGMHKDYHQVTDDSDTIDPQKAARVSQVALDVALKAANGDKRPEFTQTLKGGLADIFRSGFQKKEEGEKKRMLGVYPSSEKVKRGVKIDGVVSKSIADFAGLKAGDILLRIHKVKITEGQDIGRALKTVKSNKPFEIEILRNQENLVLKGSLVEAL